MRSYLEEIKGTVLVIIVISLSIDTNTWPRICRDSFSLRFVSWSLKLDSRLISSGEDGQRNQEVGSVDIEGGMRTVKRRQWLLEKRFVNDLRRWSRKQKVNWVETPSLQWGGMHFLHALHYYKTPDMYIPFIGTFPGCVPLQRTLLYNFRQIVNRELPFQDACQRVSANLSHHTGLVKSTYDKFR